MREEQLGFTLLELMITVAVIGILAAIAFPSYQGYVQRGKITEATTNLSDIRVRMERWFLDNRTYVGDAAANSSYPCGTPGAAFTPPGMRYFSVQCSNVTATTYTVTASGVSSDLSGFTYSLNEANQRSSTAWGSSANCWITKKGESC